MYVISFKYVKLYFGECNYMHFSYWSYVKLSFVVVVIFNFWLTVKPQNNQRNIQITFLYIHNSILKTLSSMKSDGDDKYQHFNI